MDNNNLVELGLVALIVLLICRRMSRSNKVIIEPSRYENYEQVTIDPTTGKKSDKGENYNMMGNRYLVKPGTEATEKTLADYNQYNAGANDTTDDLIWQKQSPRKTLVNNCIRGDAYGPDDKYNYPLGLPTDHSRHTDFMGGEFGAPYKAEGSTVPNLAGHQMSENYYITGIKEQPTDELSKLISNSSMQ
jgi:hypothetical protein